MLTRRAHWVLRTLLCFFSFVAVVAADWDSEREHLRETRYKLKWWITAVQTYFTVLLCAAFVLGLTRDLYMERLDASQAIVIGLWTVTAGIAAAVALTSFHGKGTIVVLNNIITMDRVLKAKLLTRQELVRFESGPSKTLNLIVFLLPLGSVWTLGASLLFFEVYDPYRRYMFVHFSVVMKFLGFEGWYIEAIGVLSYMACVGVIVGYIGLCFVAMSLYVETTSFWLAILTDPTAGRKKSKSLANLLFVFRAETLLFDIANSVPVVGILILVGFFPVTFSIYGSIALFGVINWGTYVIMPITAMSSFLIMHYFCLTMETIYAESETFIREASKRRIGHHWFGRFAKSCRPYQVIVGGFFFVRAALFPAFCAQTVDKAIMLLLS